jgi:hypothetical protein
VFRGIEVILMTKRTKRFLVATGISIPLLAFLTLWVLHSLCIISLVDFSSGQFKEQKFILGTLYSESPQPSTFFDLAVKAGVDPTTLPPPNWKVDLAKHPYSGERENTKFMGTRSELTMLAQGWEMWQTPQTQRLEQAKLTLSRLQAEKRFWVHFEDDHVSVSTRP